MIFRAFVMAAPRSYTFIDCSHRYPNSPEQVFMYSVSYSRNTNTYRLERRSGTAGRSYSSCHWLCYHSLADERLCSRTEYWSLSKMEVIRV